jgi:hypothetical protein
MTSEKKMEPKDIYKNKFNNILRKLKSEQTKRIGGLVFASILMSSPQHSIGQTNTMNPKSEYDTMIGETFRTDSKSIKCIVEATPQKAKCDAIYYLINGLDDKGEWYQFGIALDGDPQFNYTYQVWQGKKSIANDDVHAIDPSEKIRMGDTVSLELKIKRHNVIMIGKNLSNGHKVELKFKTEGSRFIGIKGDNTNDTAGRYSGIVTEIYTFSPIIQNETPVKYTNIHPSNMKSEGVWENVLIFTPDNEKLKSVSSNMQEIIHNTSANIVRVRVGVSEVGVSPNEFITSYSK